MTPIILDCQFLSVDDVVSAARGESSVTLGTAACVAMERSRQVVERAVANQEVVYGITTGFGRFADRVIPEDALEQLQHNLIMSHAVGVGSPLPPFAVRVMIVLRAASLARGYSGIRPRVVETLLEMLNRNVLPVVPSKGSVGASGDLAPLAHLALVLIGLGEADFQGQPLPGAVAMKAAGIKTVRLAAKEGLALINGTQEMTALGIELLAGARNVLEVADIVGALTLEAVRGTNRPFDRRIHDVRPHPGQIESAEHLRVPTNGSELMASHRHDSHKVQDPYSLRCMPQVHGASRDAIGYLESVLTVEINAVTDNHLIFADENEILSGGNFHGQPLAFALDFAAIALAELANISERRIEAMLDPHFSELPPFLTVHGGVDSGFMVSQYTAASLVSENKILAHPTSVDSIPISANQENDVGMGVTAGLKALTVLANVEMVLAIEFLCAAEGLDYRRPLRSSAALEMVHSQVRVGAAHVDADRPLHPDIATVTAMVRDGSIARAAMAGIIE